MNTVAPSRNVSAPTPQRVWSPSGVNIYKKLYEKSDKKLKEHIRNVLLETYDQNAKPLQVDAVFNLAQGRDTFLLAGTGFGKSRIPELYHKLFPQKARAIVLVLNPLDTLGDNQVSEKLMAGFTAINLTKQSFTNKAADKVLAGVYDFVYLSPKMFLNSKKFEKVYYSAAFQNLTALVVVDEARMIYIWGLVASGKAKTSTSAHHRFEDYGLFRPSYGKLGPQLLFRNNKPMLLLSATCRPVSIEAIKVSLKVNDETVDMLRGELTRPEIIMIRVTMINSLASSLDCIPLFPSRKDVPDSQMVPSLVYNGSRNRTMTVLNVIDRARETPGASSILNSSCSRQFHSCTGDKDKVTCIDNFAAGAFPVISCTMALGLGQNWKRVCMVAHVGRGDPAAIFQMIGRCGRDGKPGLAVMLVEKNRRGGKNKISQFCCGTNQTDLDQMDALAITPLCLRVAFLIDNLFGYVPLWADDQNYIAELERERQAGFPICRCSNCAPAEAEKLLGLLPLASTDNFEDICSGTFSGGIQPSDLKHKYPPKSAPVKKRKFVEEDKREIEEFTARLMRNITIHYNTYSPGGKIILDDLFDSDDCKSVLAHIDNIEGEGNL
ncbi:hypothetical protein PCASD_22605 [Puccinia coronata f. sp. avenae]|uniref:DNA 3'-5' helicase n=1 Tax=Puccinia coronata f. sp. avenae TaxID=200324 RepID=A0A2N5TRE3_9BASI|nr:hypothetical protein PCASD_22605 [Puccinia coronata f. sp. avenae]